MIPGDIDRELAAAVRRAAAAGELPATTPEVSAAGTWRPAPRTGRGEGPPPGSYATTLPFRLAHAAGPDAPATAALLAARLRETGWISAAEVTGGGYLTVTVTRAALAALAVRVTEAGPACARGDALRGQALTIRAADLASTRTWGQAWRQVSRAALARIAEAAGAKINFYPERIPPPDVPPARSNPVAEAIAFAGADPIRYALARRPAAPAGGIDAGIIVRHKMENPFFAVSYAHASAASAERWAAMAGLHRGEPGQLRPGLLAEPRELALLTAISWLPERVAQAARRRQPARLAAQVEDLAGAWLDCAEYCPALPAGGRAAPRDPATAAARLWLAAAARTALAAGLSLLGVSAPERL